MFEVWRFTRARLAISFDGLTDSQMRWRPFVGGHSIFEYLLHVAGAECFWASRMSDFQELSGLAHRLEQALFNSFLNSDPFPFSENEMSREFAENALQLSFNAIQPIFEAPTTDQLSMNLVSPFGDPVSGKEGLTRLAQHAAYHTGQIWMVRQMPGFPL